MMKILIPLLLVLIGTGSGIAAGMFLRPEMPVEEAQTEGGDAGEEGEEVHHAEDNAEAAERDYVKLNNQFVIPVVENGEVSSLVVLSLSVEIEPGYREEIFRKEPKLRDSFLQVLFDHANVGGFRGAFTDNNTLDVLRASLRDVAIRDAGSHVTDVLILEIARQDY